jgi:hypothetical protein
MEREFRCRVEAGITRRILVRDLVEEWWGGGTRLAPTTAANYKSNLDNHIVPLLGDRRADEMAELTRRHNDAAPVEPAVIRGHAEVARFFAGLELMEPGLVPLHRWHRPGLPPGEPAGPDVPIYGGIARKP